MKKIVLAAALITGMATAQQAEITNGFDGFETWVSAEAGELPEYWDGFNKIVEFGGMQVGSVEMVEKNSTDPYEGNYSVKITSKSIMGGPAAPGILTVGDFDVDWAAQDGDISGGEAYTQLPTMLKGYYKYIPQGLDTGFVSVWFLENGVEVGRGRLEFDVTIMGWNEFTVEIDFDQGAAPDSMNMMFSSTTAESIIPAGSVLEIDAISLESFVSVDEMEQTKLSVYPNPASDHITVDFEKSQVSEIQLVNTLGMTVFNETFNGQSAIINVNELPTGIYQLLVQSEEGIRAETIVID